MHEIIGPIIYNSLDATEVVNGDGSVNDVFTGFVNQEGASFFKEMAEATGGECQIGDPVTQDEYVEALNNHRNGKSVTLSGINRELPFLSGSAWGNKSKDPSQN